MSCARDISSSRMLQVPQTRLPRDRSTHNVRSTSSKVAKPPTHLKGLAAQQVLRHPFEITHAILAEGSHTWPKMAVFHDEVEIEDFEYDEESETYFYPCPCGDQFEITKVCRSALTTNRH